jgi:hypothetical protein
MRAIPSALFIDSNKDKSFNRQNPGNPQPLREFLSG